MLKKLGLDDEDAIDVLVELEKALDVKIANAEAAAIYTVGDLFDLLRGKMQAGETGQKCASAMAFYRVRRALSSLRPDVGRSPSANLSPLRRVYTKSFVKLLEDRSGLRLPRPDLGGIGWVGIACLSVGIFGTLAMMFLAFLTTFLGSPLIGEHLISANFLAGTVVGLAFLTVDRGRLPKTCGTLGALAASAARRSYGRLVQQGAEARDSSIWNALVEPLADMACVPADQIGRDTDILQRSSERVSTGA